MLRMTPCTFDSLPIDHNDPKYVTSPLGTLGSTKLIISDDSFTYTENTTWLSGLILSTNHRHHSNCLIKLCGVEISLVENDVFALLYMSDSLIMSMYGWQQVWNT